MLFSLANHARGPIRIARGKWFNEVLNEDPDGRRKATPGLRRGRSSGGVNIVSEKDYCDWVMKLEDPGAFREFIERPGGDQRDPSF